MNKFIFPLLLSSFMFSLVSLLACSFDTILKSEENETIIYNTGYNDGKVIIWTDPETGIEYLIYRDKVTYAGMGGITPRLDVNGEVMKSNSYESSSE